MDNIKTKEEAIKLIKKLRSDFDWEHSRKAPAMVNTRIGKLIIKFGLSSADISNEQNLE